jgi:chemotaxis protein methyltransferase CheR
MVKMSNSEANMTQMSFDELVVMVSSIMSKETGNTLDNEQKSMITTRLKKRFLDLNITNPGTYFNYFSQNFATEKKMLVSILTTHHTFFFREFVHFEYIIKNLPQIVQNVKNRGEKVVRVLSAACSKGHEVYSLGMLLEKHLKHFPGIEYSILGTDIDESSVKFAQNGVYPFDEVKVIPQIYLGENWQKGTGEIENFAKIKKSIKSKCDFKIMNLVEMGKVLKEEKFDFIFCRNVFIYFKMDLVEKIVLDFKKHLYPTGFFVTGKSESLLSLTIKKEVFGPSIYGIDPVKQKETDKTAANINRIDHSKIASVSNPTLVPNPKDEPILNLIPQPIKMLIVDDSGSIVKLLTKIFQADPEFQVVGSAQNGQEAEEFLKNNKVDAMTLDINMPVMDGVQYLQKNFKAGHPHVVIVSSVSREDTHYAQKTFEYGASDFVEKPSLNNIGLRAEEIKSKIKMAFLNSEPSNSKSSKSPIHKKSNLDEAFKNNFVISKPLEKSRLLMGNFSDIKRINGFITDIEKVDPPTFWILEGNQNIMNVIKEKLDPKIPIEIFHNDTEIKTGTLYLCDYEEHQKFIMEKYKDKTSSILVFGVATTKKMGQWILEFKKSQILQEDLEGVSSSIKEKLSDIFPYTSFYQISRQYLAKN